MLSGAPPHDPAKYDGDHNRPRIAAGLIRPTKSCRNRLDETPLSELTRWESATFGGYCTSRWTWSSAALNSAKVAPKSAHTCAMTCSPRVSISVSNTPRLYVVTNTRWTWRLWTALRPRRVVRSGSCLGVGGRSYVACHEVPAVPERRAGGAPVGAVRPRPVRVEPRPRAAPDVGALEGTDSGIQRPSRAVDCARAAEPWLACGSQTVQQ